MQVKNQTSKNILQMQFKPVQTTTNPNLFKNILTIVVVCFLLGLFAFQTYKINTLQKKIDSNYTELYKQFLYNKNITMDSVYVNSQIIVNLQRQIQYLKKQLNTAQPVYYDMTPNQLNQYMFYIVEKYKK